MISRINSLIVRTQANSNRDPRPSKKIEKTYELLVAIIQPETHLSWFIVSETVIKHQTKIINAFLATSVFVVFQFSLDDSHVHGLLDDRVVILKKRSTARQQVSTKRQIRKTRMQSGFILTGKFNFTASTGS